MDKSLNALRVRIDEIDEQMLNLLNERARVVIEVGKVKKTIGENFHAPEREREVIEKLQQKNKGPFPNSALRAVFREIMSASLSLESPIKVAYLGPKATFTHLACIKKFGFSAVFIPTRNIEDVFGEVEHDRADYGVVPIENSTEGVISHTLDMFIDSDLKICAEVLLPISHNLISQEQRLTEVETIYSHPHAIAQTKQWLKHNVPEVTIVEVSSTAYAAELASENPKTAAIASEAAALTYNLGILKRRIEDNVKNVTRFLLIGKRMGTCTGKDKTSIMFSIKDSVGALFRILKPFAENGINLTKIESRPSRRKAWEYIFYIDMLGHVEDLNIKTALSDLERHCLFLQVLGSYPLDDTGGS